MNGAKVHFKNMLLNFCFKLKIINSLKCLKLFSYMEE